MTRGRFVQGLFGEIVIYGMLPLNKTLINTASSDCL